MPHFELLPLMAHIFSYEGAKDELDVIKKITSYEHTTM
jgi:hypothetical protein